MLAYLGFELGLNLCIIKPILCFSGYNIITRGYADE